MPFIVNPNFYHVLINGTLNVAAPGYLDNDVSTVGTVTASLVDGPDHGTWSASTDGSFQYTPVPGFTGIDTVTVRETNGIASKDSIITIDVYSPSDPRVVIIYPNFYNVPMNGVADVAAPGYLDNDFTTSGTLTTPTLLDGPDHGTWSALVNGRFTYRPNSGFTGVDTVLVSVSNGTVVKSETVTFNVYGPNDTPLLNANTGLTVLKGLSNALGVGLLDFNDDDNTDAQITYTVTAATANGTLFNNGSALGVGGTFTQADINAGLVSYTHNGSETTADSFGFTVSDGAGGSVTGQSFALTITPRNGTLDFNADGVGDVLWRHNNGFVSEWLMNAGHIGDNLGVAMPGLAWHFQDSGDFNADSKTDILWRHDSGQVVLWTMDGNQIVANQSVATLGNDWHNQGVGDFGGDGKSDVLWHNDSGQVALWTMDGAQITNNQLVATIADSWHVQGLLDANGDGKRDVLLRHDSGQVVLWTMDGAQITDNQSVANLGLDWNIVGTGDFGGDGKGDVLLRNDNGQVVLWTMNGKQIVSNQSVATPGNDWHVQDIDDYNSDGRSDVLWRHDSGQVVMWEMNGAQIASNHTVTYQGGTPAPVGNDWTVLSHHYDVL